MNGGTGRHPRERPVRELLGHECRWQRDQQSRRRRMTQRGRLTIATVLVLAAIGLAWLLGTSQSALGSSGAAVAAPAPVADVAAPPAGAPPAPPDRAPRALLERLPVTQAALELPARPAGPAHPESAGRLYEEVGVESIAPALPSPIRVEYTLDAELMRDVFRVLRKGRVALGHVILLEPDSGRVLAYASTDIERFPPTRSYPAASLVKIVTAAAALDRAPKTARLPCRYRGSPYRLTPSRIDPPDRGHTVTLRRALATSNNQCFAQLAVHAVGIDPLLDAIGRFGWLSRPAPAHAPGSAAPALERFEIGRLGCGLSGSRITPLHAAQLASVLAHGELVTPRWIERIVDARGGELPLPAAPARRQVLSPDITQELREMLVDTTQSGTARRAFRGRGGAPLLGPVKVAGKTGSLSGEDPDGRYEWFVGIAPAEAPRVAIAVLLVQGDLWWRTASQVAAEVLQDVFCEGSRCSAERASRFVRVPETTAAMLSIPGVKGG